MRRPSEPLVIHSIPTSPLALDRIKVLKRLSKDNRNLPFIVDEHREANSIYIITAWIKGRPLRFYLDEIERGRRIPVLQAVRLITGLAHGLYHLHNHLHVIHGDIRPENLILSPRSNKLVMVDFGSAWIVERTTRRFNAEGSDPFYTAPELFAVNANTQEPIADPRADQFSASVILFELLTGTLPFSGLGGKAGHPEFRTGQPTAPASSLYKGAEKIPRRVWNAIDAVITKGLALEPDKRHRSDSEWIEALKNVEYQSRRADETPTLTKAASWIYDAFIKKRT